MITHQIDTLFNDVTDRQIASMPYLTADRAPAEKHERNTYEPNIARLTEIMPQGEVMRFCDIYRTAHLPHRQTRSVLESSKDFEKVGHGKWRRL